MSMQSAPETKSILVHGCTIMMLVHYVLDWAHLLG